MIKEITIIGSSLEALQQAHIFLDKDPSTLITIITEDAEAGFSENPPEPIILNEALESISSKWYGLIPEAVDRDNLSSTSSSWLVKALGIRLAERGAKFLLHTRVSKIDEENKEVSFQGGGEISKSVQRYGQLLDYREK